MGQQDLGIFPRSRRKSNRSANQGDAQKTLQKSVLVAGTLCAGALWRKASAVVWKGDAHSPALSLSLLLCEVAATPPLACGLA